MYIIFTLTITFVIVNIIVIWTSLKFIKINHHLVVFNNLPSNLQDLKILHISDLHNRSKTKKTLDIWPYIHNLDFDIAFITGDIVVNKANQIDPHKKDLLWLSKKVPTFYIEGNHDADHHSYLKIFMKETGITFLYNDIITINIKNTKVDIVGTKDYLTLLKTNFVGFKNLFERVNNSKHFNIVLTHQPQLFDNIKNENVNLVLSGHTHGGQVRLPFLPTLYAPCQGILPKYGSGFYYYKQAILFITKGIGATSFPIRYFNRPCIEILKLSSNIINLKRLKS